MQSSFYHCIIQVLFITHNTCGICNISENVDRTKLRTNQIHVTKCLFLTCDKVFVVCYSCTNCDNFGFSVTYLLTLSAKLVKMLHRTNIRLLNWAVNLFTLFCEVQMKIFHLICDTLWHIVTHGPCDMVTLWHRSWVIKYRLIMCNPSKPKKWKLLHRNRCL